MINVDLKLDQVIEFCATLLNTVAVELSFSPFWFVAALTITFYQPFHNNSKTLVCRP